MAYVERPGVILGVAPNMSADVCNDITKALSDRFPGVQFAVVPGVIGGLAFPWFEEVPDGDVRPR